MWPEFNFTIYLIHKVPKKILLTLENLFQLTKFLYFKFILLFTQIKFYTHKKFMFTMLTQIMSGSSNIVFVQVSLT